ncbi:mitogen-activated protein kinase kinase kinase 5 isoform X2 [Cucumis sativus]|uniref:mitogen-activated protein kinase kinase kinase 5 isoform X2 n=1 Tax=Cucumis sativus TaxID=3659 RepID=UPI0012F4A5C3|nr:mitogen-activated protein kinase kinase kinase 5 isoform X2 [Cucumis sativus]
MRWLRNISFTPSSMVRLPGSTTGGGDSPTRRSTTRGSAENNYRGIVWRFGASRYSRHRKLRNLSGREHVDSSLAKWSDTAPEPVSLSRSPSTSDHPAVPLPLPEVSPLFQPRERISTSNSAGGEGDCPLPSPKGSRGRAGDERDVDRDRNAPPQKIGGGISPNASIKSVSDSVGERHKKEGQIEARLSGRANQDARRYPENSRNGFWIDVPSRSAPTSPYTSPTPSPQRNISGNISNFHYMSPVGNQGWSAPELPNFPCVAAPVGNHVWSAPELPSSAMMRGVPPAFFDCSTLSTESSPMHSPRGKSPHLDPRSPTGPTSPLHAKISHETHAMRREGSGHVSVHPLPLPPGVPMPSASIPTMASAPTSINLSSPPVSSPSHSIPSASCSMALPSTPMASPSTPISQANTKSESISMKNQWQKGKLIGRGTFGSVYVASNRQNGALCAMKEVELFHDDPKSAESIKQLEQEIKLLSQLKHPNIVQYYGSDIIDDRLYIYLEYVHPGSINKYVREHCGAMTESVVRNFTRHILSGLAYLHSTKTIHRDIKGANLLVDSCGVVKLADFGMAKHLTGQVADLSLKGSPYWMAPELLLSVMQKDNTPDLALAVDIWSLGCTIIEMFTGKPPWSEYEGAAAMFKVMKDTPPMPESLSYEARDFLKCCFQRNPAERPTAAMLLEHPFMKNLQYTDASSCSQDKCYSPSKQYSSKSDQSSMLPSPQNSKGKLAADNVIGPLSHHETSDLTVMSRYSPRSTLEALPMVSPLRSVPNAHHYGSPTNAADIVNQINRKNHTLI